DPGYDLPESPLGVRAAQRIEHDASGTLAPRRSTHIDGLLGHAGMRRASAIGTGARPGDDPTIVLGNERRKAIPLVEQLRGDLFGAPRLGLERGAPFGDPFVVDRGRRP